MTKLFNHLNWLLNNLYQLFGNWQKIHFWASLLL